MALTGKQRHHLRSLAHHLDPVVHIGHEGVSPAVLSQIDAALAAHELIKVRISADSPDGREEAAELISAGTKSEIAQVIGRIVVVFRRRTTKKKAKVALSPAGLAGQKGSKGRPPSQRAKAKQKTAVARANKRQKRDRRRSAASE